MKLTGSEWTTGHCCCLEPCQENGTSEVRLLGLAALKPHPALPEGQMRLTVDILSVLYMLPTGASLAETGGGGGGGVISSCDRSCCSPANSRACHFVLRHHCFMPTGRVPRLSLHRENSASAGLAATDKAASLTGSVLRILISSPGVPKHHSPLQCARPASSSSSSTVSASLKQQLRLYSTPIGKMMATEAAKHADQIKPCLYFPPSARHTLSQIFFLKKTHNGTHTFGNRPQFRRWARSPRPSFKSLPIIS